MKKQLLLILTIILINMETYSQTMLEPAAMKYDLSVLKAAWENVHGGLYRYNNKAQIDNYFKDLDQKTNQPLLLKSFFMLVSQLNIKLHCGHSFVSYYNNRKAIRTQLYSNVFMPLLFKVIEGKFVITHNLTENKAINTGDEIIAINGYQTKRIIDSLLTVSKADGLNGLNKQLDNISIYQRDIGSKQFCLFDIYFPLFFKQDLNSDDYKITVRSKNKVQEIIVKGVTKEEREKLFTTKYGEMPKDEKSWYIKPVDKKTVIFRLGDFATYNWKFDFKKYLDSVFLTFNRKGYKNLIVDIRQNEGGADDARDAVLSYLTSKPIGCANAVRRLYRYTSIPDSLLPYLDTWDDSFKKPKTGYKKTADGYYESEKPGPGCEEINPNPNYFKGKLFLIIDVTNSSATFIMADAFKRNKLGKIVGETTGGSQQGINGGEIFFFYLPKSGIEMDIPLIWQAPINPKPDEGIKPDYEVKTTAKDVAEKRDVQVEFILKKLIK
ncbi:MAG: hypothetical protein JNK27_05815 [Chitinophagaceae bacterium]|nr:hypothetical protein [Chitinophagaceae bacterium]